MELTYHLKYYLVLWPDEGTYSTIRRSVIVTEPPFGKGSKVVVKTNSGLYEAVIIQQGECVQGNVIRENE